MVICVAVTYRGFVMGMKLRRRFWALWQDGWMDKGLGLVGIWEFVVGWMDRYEVVHMHLQNITRICPKAWLRISHGNHTRGNNSISMHRKPRRTDYPAETKPRQLPCAQLNSRASRHSCVSSISSGRALHPHSRSTESIVGHSPEHSKLQASTSSRKPVG